MATADPGPRCNSPFLSTLSEESIDKVTEEMNKKLDESVHVIHNALEFQIYESQEYWKAITTVVKYYSRFKKKIHKEHRLKLIKLLLDTKSISNMSLILKEQLKDALQTLKKRKEFKSISARSIIYTTLQIFNDFAEESETFASEAAKKSCAIIDCLKILLDDFKLLHFRQDLGKELTEVLFVCLALSYNLVMHDDSSTVNAVRERNLMKSVRPYVYSTDRFKILSFMFMLYVSNEAELCSDPMVVGELLNHLMAARAAKEKTSGKFTSKELMRALEKLTVLGIDRNLLYDIGIVDKMKELLFSGDVDEIQSSLCVLTNYIFDVDKEVAKEIHEKVYTFTQENILKHENLEIQKAAVSLIWVLDEKLSIVDGEACESSDPRVFRRSASRCPQPESDHPSLDGGMGTIPVPQGTHIMLSYQWDYQPKVRRIKEYLEGKGFLVWYDEDKMEMNLLDSMAAAVESAWVILICYSRKYKLSKNCRLEAEYASKLKIPMIPVQMEDYDPDGWLGLLIGRLLFHRFCNEQTAPETYAQLLGALKGLKRKLHVGDCETLNLTEPAIRRTIATVCGAATTTAGTTTTTFTGDTIATLRSQADASQFGQDLTFLGHWSEGELDRWFTDLGLNRELLGVQTGRDLRLLLQMKKESPNTFFKYLTKRYSLSEISTFTDALQDLIFKQRLNCNLPIINFPT